MPTAITMTVEFDSPKSGRMSFTDSVRIEEEPSASGKRNLASEMFIELHRSVSFLEHWRALPDIGDLLSSPTSRHVRTDPMAFMDVFNVPALWLEISNTFRDLRYVLAQAKAYKDLEPLNTTPATNDICAYAHFEKMYKLNLAVYDLVKVQDLVVRLLQEGFSGKLIHVDYDDEDWEQKLTMNNAKNGLKALKKAGELAQVEFEKIMSALGPAFPKQVATLSPCRTACIVR